MGYYLFTAIYESIMVRLFKQALFKLGGTLNDTTLFSVFFKAQK